jgi:hypothetical protein
MRKPNQRDIYGSGALRRRGQVREQLRLVLFSCEGAKTEPNYVTALCRDLGLAPPAFAAKGADPSYVVEEAVKAFGKAPDDEYDAVWCVFDRDDHEHFSDALQRARDRGYHAAHCNPCFELWFLLHFRDSTSPLSRDEARSECEQFIQGYTKSMDVHCRLTEEQQEAALRNAQRLRDHHGASGGGPYANPSTSVDLMVLALRDLAGR